MRFSSRFPLILWVCLLSARSFAAGKAAHVIMIVWDGMRPDFVSPEHTPTLSELGARGVIFRNHHSAYVTSTEVNAAVLATGAYPGVNGITGNNEFRPAVNPTNKIMTAELGVVRKADGAGGNRFLTLPTVAESLHRQGRRTAVAGAKEVGLLADRLARADDSLGAVLFDGRTLPESMLGAITNLLGPFPPAAIPKARRDQWTTEALIGPLWGKEAPAFSVLWLSEPDASQHATGPGSQTSLAAIRSSDSNLRRVLDVLDRRGLREQTDIIVVSDHGFSTVFQIADVTAVLKTNGFAAVNQLSPGGARTGDIVVVNNGGTVFLYVTGHDADLTAKAVHFLQTQPFCGVVLTREPVEGAFRLADARIDSPDAPDIVMSLCWQPDKSTNGTPGLIGASTREYGVGKGTHSSLSLYDLHNTCVAAGPDFRPGFTDDLPTGNVDVAPTILWILGVAPEAKLSGRVLSEALADSRMPVPAAARHRLEANWSGAGGTWRQTLDYSEVNGVIYLDQGNGKFDGGEPKAAGSR